ncbi:SRPBCC family protein [Streptomyces sp. NPDC059637]|uniref:SRPBCC family protein n=1 Tax=Streptomyces sp. NPDC059637 TaxID=3347752 RepID=UPI00367CE1F2
MRYTDGPGTRCETHIDAAPQTVWKLVADIGTPARTSPELQRVEWLDGADAPALGARFAGHNRNPVIGEWRTVSEIAELDTERVLCWAVLDTEGRFGEPARTADDALATWRFDLEPAGDGTLLRHSVRLGPGPSGLSRAIERMPEKEEELLAGRLAQLHAGMEATLEGIKELAEGTVTGVL